MKFMFFTSRVSGKIILVNLDMVQFIYPDENLATIHYPNGDSHELAESFAEVCAKITNLE